MTYDPAYHPNAPGAPMPAAAPNYYAAPAQPYAQAPVQAGSLVSDGARRISKPLMGLLGVTAGFPVLAWIVSAVTRPSTREVSSAQWETMQLVDTALTGVKSLLMLVAFIFFAIWIHRLIKGYNAAGQPTRVTPGMAVGWWFVPFANFVMPFIAVKDAWRVGTRGQGAGLVGAWWGLYMLVTLLNMGSPVLSAVLPFDPSIAFVFTAIFWLGFLGHIGAYTCWLLIVQRLSSD